MIKKFFMLSAALLVLIFSSQANAENFKIDYGESKIFSKADMDFCIEIINEQLKRSGCTLHVVRYVGDKKSNSRENIKYLNSLAESRNFKKKFSKCLLFETEYLSPPDPHDGKPTAWNYDTEYKNYMWYFGFYKIDGEWKLLTSGY